MVLYALHLACLDAVIYINKYIDIRIYQVYENTGLERGIYAEILGRNGERLPPL